MSESDPEIEFIREIRLMIKDVVNADLPKFFDRVIGSLERETHSEAEINFVMTLRGLEGTFRASKNDKGGLQK